MSTSSRKKLLFLGNHGVWGQALYGSQLRSERIASGLTAAYDVTYACMGSQPQGHEHTEWLSRRNISRLVVGEPFDMVRSARWGGPIDLFWSLAPHRVPIEIRERATADFVDKLKSLAASIDVVWAHRSWMAEAAHRAGFDSIVCDIDDFEGELVRQYGETIRSRRAPLFKVLNRRLSTYERSIHERFARVVVTKEEDRSLINFGKADNCHVVPNGFDLPAALRSQALDRKILLFVGTLGYGPNIDAILWFYSQILPSIRRVHPDAEFHVVGKGPTPDPLAALADDPLIRIEVSPASLNHAYAGARVVVTPIRLGHGTRIKALEAIAYSRPLVSTSECLRGHPISNGQHALVADTASDFSAACIRVLDDHQLAERLSRDGRLLAERIGGWNHSAAEALKILESL